MRHRVKLNHLGRKTAHRKALLSHLACDLIRHKRIITTLAKAKALRVYVEPLITKSKTNTTHQRRVVFSYLQDKQAVTELFSDVSARIGSRAGGYTRIIKLGARLGDAAEMALIELVDYNEIYSNEPADTGRKKRTRRGSRAKKAAPAEEVKTAAEETNAQDTGTTEAETKAEAKKEAAPEKKAEEKEKAPEAEAEPKAEAKAETDQEADPKAEKPKASKKEAKKADDDKDNKKTAE